MNRKFNAFIYFLEFGRDNLALSLFIYRFLFYRESEDKGMKIALHVSSTHSLEVSLRDIKNGKAGFDSRRKSLFDRVPESGNFANFQVNSLITKDLAYLSAYTGHEFAILRGKKNDILYHGTSRDCTFDDDEISSLLKSGKLRLYAHSHPDYKDIIPSNDDRMFLKNIGQESSIIVSWITGKEQLFTSNLFDI